MKLRYVVLVAVAFGVAPIAKTFGQAPAATAETRRAAATRLTAGTWTGTVTPPQGEAVTVEYDVASTKDSATIVIIGRGNRFPTTAVRFENGSLRFSWSPGPTLDCALAVQSDGGFAGDCSDGAGAPGKLVMTPPKKS